MGVVETQIPHIYTGIVLASLRTLCTHDSTQKHKKHYELKPKRRTISYEPKTCFEPHCACVVQAPWDYLRRGFPQIAQAQTGFCCNASNAQN